MSRSIKTSARKTTKATPKPVASKKSKRVASNSSPKSASRSALADDILIYQIYYKGEQRRHLDAAFTALDNKEAESETHEFAVFERLFNTSPIKAAKYWGAVSWRFHEKTGLTGEKLVSVIQKNPNVDVFYMNPFPYNEALFQSGWMQGETVHPDFLALSEKVLVAAGYDRDEVYRVNNSAAFSSANYFVGNQKFWSLYIPFVQKILSESEKRLPVSILKILHSNKADARNLHNQSTYVPFIVERLFPLFMMTAGKSLVASKVMLPEQERKLNEHLRKLREMKDAAVKGKSEWLLRIWMNYRNLYLQSVTPKDWREKYLPVLNPKEIIW